MSRPLVYLAGPITGLSYGGATDWREAAKERLADHDILGLSPMRAKEYLSQETSIGDSYEESILSCQKGITARDRFDCQRVDIVLVNLLGAERASLGSMIEFGWADSARVPIVTVLEEGSIHDHAMVREMSGFIANNLDDTLNTIIAILGEH